MTLETEANDLVGRIKLLQIRHGRKTFPCPECGEECDDIVPFATSVKAGVVLYGVASYRVKGPACCSTDHDLYDFARACSYAKELELGAYLLLGNDP